MTSIKRSGQFSHWREFIEREQSSVDQLLQESFAEYCKNSSDRKFSSLHRKPDKSEKNRNTKTMPRKIPGMDELESLYAPMKNLLEPLPNARYDDVKMPEPHPLFGVSSKRDDEDLESEVCSVIIPPPLPPVQSHAVLFRGNPDKKEFTPVLPKRNQGKQR